MKRIIATLLIISAPAVAANPLRAIRGFFSGRYGVTVSLGAVGAANACDYRTTVNVVNSGAGYEANPLLQNSRGLLSQDRLAASKVFSFALPVALEAWLRWRHPAAFARYRGPIILGNWLDAAGIGAVALHNRQVYIREGVQ